MKIINIRRLTSLAIVFIIIFTLLISYAKSVGEDISDSVLRLHILANSNLPKDLNLKLAVRDRLICEASELFADADSALCAKHIAEENSDLIKHIAEDEIRRQGFDYPVSVTVEKVGFPTKSYRDITLPCGQYNAVRVKIGNADGENWWCVMYPPLCFIDGIICADDTAKAQLKNCLNRDEYALITGTDDGCMPVEIRFKIVEIIQKLLS